MLSNSNKSQKEHCKDARKILFSMQRAIATSGGKKD